MSGPERLRLKRRLGDRPPDELIVEGQAKQKRSFTDSMSERLKYVLKQGKDNVEPLNNFTTPQGPVVESGGNFGLEDNGARRTFHLSRAGIESLASGKKRRVRDEDLVTVEERKVRQNAQINGGGGDEDERATSQASRPLKRPGRGSAVRPQQQRQEIPMQSSQDGMGNGAERQNIQSIANNLHQFALEELVKDNQKPKMTSMPNLAGARSRELHRQRVAIAQTQRAAATEDVDMEDDGGAYVYDTYVLVPTASQAADEQTVTAQLASRNVGYIVITDADVEAWEMYMEDEASDKDWDSEDEDENAEGYYGADYPEDELASDDELDRGAYGYRNHAGSDDEEYDEDTGAYSDEGEDLWRRKTPAEFARHVAAGQEGV